MTTFSTLPTTISDLSRLGSRIRTLSTAATTITPGSTSSHPSPATTTTFTTDQHDSASSSPRLTTPLVSKYLFVVAGMVFCIVIVGGMTRLTESGLSITEWNVISGMKLPITGEDWEIEFEKYRATPEWKM